MLRITNDHPMDVIGAETKAAYSALTRRWVLEVDVYFDGEANPPTTLTQEDINSCSLLEEFISAGGDLLGTVSSNEFIFAVDNTSRDFSPTNVAGLYYGKLLPHVKVCPYLGIYINETDSVGVLLGTFWTREWEAPSQGVEATVSCYDALYYWGQLFPTETRVQEGTTVADFFAQILQSVGLAPSDYIIDGALAIPLKYSWCLEDTLLNLLQQVARGIAFINVTRTGKLQIRSLDVLKNCVAIASMDDENQIIGMEIPTEYFSKYTRVTMEINLPGLEPTTEILRTNITVPALETLNIQKLSLNKAPIGLVQSIHVDPINTIIEVEDIQTTALSLSLALTNSDAAAHEITLSSYGKPLNLNTAQETLINTDLELLTGVKELIIKNEYIQDRVWGLDRLDMLLKLVSDPTNRVQVLVRGNPALVLGEAITLANPSDKLGTTTGTLVSRELRYDGGIEETYQVVKDIVSL